MDVVVLNPRTDEDIMEFPQVNFEIEAVIGYFCTPLSIVVHDVDIM